MLRIIILYTDCDEYQLRNFLSKIDHTINIIILIVYMLNKNTEKISSNNYFI